MVMRPLPGSNRWDIVSFPDPVLQDLESVPYPFIARFEEIEST